MKPLAALAALVCVLPSLSAVDATGLSSFEGLEQPAQRYLPAAKKAEPEVYQAITDEGNGTFKMALRYRPDWWDGDRDTGNRDRQRAEVKGLGPHQKLGETFEYATTWRIDSGYHGTNRFFHIFQLKATEGDDGAPLITMSLQRDPHRAAIKLWSGNDRGSRAVREFSYNPGEWTSVRIRVRTSTKGDGEVLVSVNGDPFKGLTGVEAYRTDAEDYRPKWGMYRGLTAGMNLSDDFVEHREVSARNLAGPMIDNGALEKAARAKASNSSIPAALEWLQSQPDTPGRIEATGTIGSLWADTDPAAAMNWAFEKKSYPGRAQTLLRIYDRWQTREAAPAVAWLIAHAPDPDLNALLWYQATDTSFRHGQSQETLQRCAALITDPALRQRTADLSAQIAAHSGNRE